MNAQSSILIFIGLRDVLLSLSANVPFQIALDKSICEMRKNTKSSTILFGKYALVPRNFVNGGNIVCLSFLSLILSLAVKNSQKQSGVAVTSCSIEGVLNLQWTKSILCSEKCHLWQFTLWCALCMKILICLSTE